MASRAPNGSSISSTSASWASALASATRCRMPPDSSCGRFLPNPARWTASSSSAARCLRSALRTPRARSASSTLPAAVSQGNRPGSWNISATRPPTDISPLVGWSSPATRLRSVDLPQPDAPIRQVNSPGSAARLTWSRAGTALPPRPYTLETPASVTAAGASVTAVALMVLSAHRRLAGGAEQVVERGEVEDPAQVDRLEQPDGLGLLRVGAQRRGVRVGGEGDLLPRRAEHCGLERVGGGGGEFRVGRGLGA